MLVLLGSLFLEITSGVNRGAMRTTSPSTSNKNHRLLSLARSTQTQFFAAFKEFAKDEFDERALGFCNRQVCVDQACQMNDVSLQPLGRKLLDLFVDPPEKFVIATLGDSVTFNAGRANYGAVLRHWFRLAAPPKTEVVTRNIGIPATGPAFGTRCNALQGDEDIIFIQYVRLSEVKHYEALVRELLKHPNKPAVILVNWKLCVYMTDEEKIFPLSKFVLDLGE